LEVKYRGLDGDFIDNLEVKFHRYYVIKVICMVVNFWIYINDMYMWWWSF
jgi:hypothetical protein